MTAARALFPRQEGRQGEHNRTFCPSAKAASKGHADLFDDAGLADDMANGRGLHVVDFMHLGESLLGFAAVSFQHP